MALRIGRFNSLGENRRRRKFEEKRKPQAEKARQRAIQDGHKLLRDVDREIQRTGVQAPGAGRFQEASSVSDQIAQLQSEVERRSPIEAQPISGPVFGSDPIFDDAGNVLPRTNTRGFEHLQSQILPEPVEGMTFEELQLQRQRSAAAQEELQRLTPGPGALATAAAFADPLIKLERAVTEFAAPVTEPIGEAIGTE